MRITLLGDTMLGRSVGDRLRDAGPAALFSRDVVDLVHEADLVVANLECCISDRGEPADKVFVFRGPPVAAEALALLGVDAVSLANNHSLDYGPDALADTLVHLGAAGVAAVGAGADVDAARRPLVLDAAGRRVAIVACTDHPRAFAAGPTRPGVAFADLDTAGPPAWLTAAVRDVDADLVIVSPHWGPNMVAAPVPHVRRAAGSLVAAGATIVAGHSAHVFHGFAPPVLFDLGDFVDDYARDRALRNDLGIIVTLELDDRGPVAVDAVPIALDFCHTRLAHGDEAAWVEARLRRACEQFDVEVTATSRGLRAAWVS
jgi:poly-gamma-glutamate synthesis protein (capsule biosynthesis protein)